MASDDNGYSAYPGGYMSPLVKCATTQGYTMLLSPVWLESYVPREMRPDKKDTLAWVRLVAGDNITEDMLPNWWPEDHNYYFHRPELGYAIKHTR
jgi:hypothetical protein